MALAGRQTFNSFEDVIRLRRIHRQKGVDEFKDSTMRLRDVANTMEDYELWKHTRWRISMSIQIVFG